MKYAIDLCIYANSFVDSFFKNIHRSNQNVHPSSRAKLRTVECQGLLNDRTKINTQRRSGSIYGRNKFNAIFLYQRQRLSWISYLTHCSSNVHYAKCNVHRRSKVSVQAAYENMSTVAHKTWLTSNDWMTVMLHGYALLKISYLGTFSI